MNEAVISVIIPVYKVERYLDRCVESVLRQSYSHLEILLVDDGSPDRCGRMCDQWAEKDPRVRVIHKENGGLSSARNVGLDAATGKYIAFVDSDDYIAPDMFRLLHKALVEHHADMSICNFYFVDEAGSILEEDHQDTPITAGVFSGMETIKRITGNKHWYYNPAWNKLYKSVLFSDIRYPEDVTCAEDAFVVHWLLGLCTSVVCIDDRCYYYTQREESITHRRTQKEVLCDAESYLDRAIYCYDHGLNDEAARFYWWAAMILSEVCAEKNKDSSLRIRLVKDIRLFRKNICICSPYSMKKKLQIEIVLRSPRMYYLLKKIFKKIH